MKITKTVILIILLFNCSFLRAQTTGGVATQDYNALVALYTNLDGNNWTNRTNWLNGNVSTWFGVFVESGRVTKIELFNNKLKGSLPFEIRDLTELKSIDLSNNEISGSIPPGFTNLTKLEYIYLQSNKIVGTLPNNIGNLTLLKKINISENRLTGIFPDSFWTLKFLIEIQFRSNLLQGGLPEEIGNLTELQVLRLENNLLEGPLPYGLWNLTKLVRLQLTNNNFWGQIVENIGNLTSLRFLYLHGNEFSGKLPASLYSIVSLQELRVGDNNFIGTIPPDISNLENLRIFEVQSNGLDGNIPIEIGNLLRLEQIDLSDNNFTGVIPSEIGNLKDLNSIKLFDNQFSGSIPNSFWGLTKLETCNISDNKFSGTIPEQIGNLKNLKIFEIKSNNFSGNFPSSIGNLTNLRRLYINDNFFSGNLPSTINKLSLLQDLNIRNNDFVGLPVFYVSDSLVNLDSFICDYNKFTFEDFQINKLMLTTIKVTYGPQKKFGVKRDYYATDNNPFSFNIKCGGSNLNYVWMSGAVENGSKTPPKGSNISTSNDKIQFSPVYIKDYAYYNVLVTNNDPEFSLSLESEDVHLIVSEDCIKHDSLALVDFYNFYNEKKITWDSTRNWLTGPINTWYGITIDNCNVISIELPGNNIRGRLPATIIGNFPKLKVLNLSGNKIDGDIPSQISGLTSLEVLNLGKNFIEGEIPSTIRDLVNLKYLDLSHNQMDGTIPPQLGDVSSLEVLKLNNNNFSGDINGNISDLKNISHLNISYNRLTGSIGKTISGMPKVGQFIANNNQLTGNIPTSVGLLASLDTLRLEYNLLDGEIPPEIGNAANLIYLGLSHNGLTGALPQTLWNLTNLKVLLLGNNLLLDEISSDIGKLVNLNVLSLDHNNFEGEIPASFRYLSNLEYAYLNSNHFEGELIDGVTDFKNLAILKLDNNHFSEIPSLNNVSDTVTTEFNKLTFEDLERSTDSIRRGNVEFSYIPQDSIGRRYDTLAIEGSLFVLPIFCGGANNHYQWYKDGVEYKGPDSYTLTFNAFQPSDTGYYHITVTNDSIDDLTLTSYPVHVILLPGPQPESPECGIINTELDPRLCWTDLKWEESYSIQIATDILFTDESIVVDETGLTSNCFVENYVFGTTYYWKVNATKDGVTSSWSEICSFTTKPKIPDCPELLSPEENTEFFYDKELTISWKSPERADTIIFQYSKDPNFESYDSVVGDGSFELYSFDPLELENATYYYWRVIAKNYTGRTEGCEIRTLIPAIEVIPVNLVAIDGSHITTFTVKNIETYPDNSLKIYNKWGKLIYQTKGTGYLNEFDFIDYPSGTYYYILNVSNGKNSKQYKSFVEVVKK